jgi:hypothetical protein
MALYNLTKQKQVNMLVVAHTKGGIRMSNPNLPNITPTIDLTRDDVVNLLFSSIAMEELRLAHH